MSTTKILVTFSAILAGIIAYNVWKTLENSLSVVADALV